jgi:aspartyl-tRNA(Asn)/glutamyl-tRNA(Gln) amidotransferase subunit A
VVKDSIDIAGVPTTDGTTFRTGRALSDAPLVQRLRAWGAIIFAKGNMHEYGIQPVGINPHYGTPVNPWAPERIPGGSSSGPAVAVASGLAAAAVGTDAGGSIRVPATLNGLVGLKPTYDAIPREGTAKLTRDLDHLGPIAWTVDDAALLFEAMASVSLRRHPEFGDAAVLSDFFTGAEPRVIEVVRNAIAAVFGSPPEVPTPMAAWAVQVEFVVVGDDASKLMAEELATFGDRMAADSRLILRLGGGVTPQLRRRADGVRRAMRAELDALLERFDVLIGPATGRFAPPLSRAARKGEMDAAGIAQLAAVAFPANLTGLPACVVPCVKDGLPMGIQLIGRHGEEWRVLSAAKAVESQYGPRRPARWYGQETGQPPSA